MSDENRIFFKGNPWPEGHPIAEFEWHAERRGDRVWCNVHLSSAEYYSERDIQEDPENDDLGDWEAPIVWGNYHRCIMSNTYWGDTPFDFCAVDSFSADALDGFTCEVNPNLKRVQDVDDLAFGIYLLGHDACANHKMTFRRIGQTQTFDIDWSGKIALAYAGDYDFKYDFRAKICGVPLPKLATSD